MKILIVENEATLLEEVIAFLTAKSYSCDVARSASAAVSAIISDYYDVVICNISSLDKQEIELLRLLKTSKYINRTILTGTNTHKLEALDMVNIEKPYTPAMLYALIRLIARNEKQEEKGILFFNELLIDIPGRAVSVKGETVNLTRFEFDLLLYFVNNKTKVLSKDNIAL
jgi:DNA-binding response OmpR family regulator